MKSPRLEINGWEPEESKPKSNSTNGQTPVSPRSGSRVKNPSARGAAILAFAISVEMPFGDSIVVSRDHSALAVCAMRDATFRIADISRIDIMQTIPECDLSSLAHGRHRSGAVIQHFEIRMKCREMERHIRTQM